MAGTLKDWAREAGERRPSVKVIDFPCSAAFAQAGVRKRSPAEGGRPPRCLPFLRSTFNAIPPGPRLVVGLPLTYIVLTGVFLAWLIGLTVLAAGTLISDLSRRALRWNLLAARGGESAQRATSKVGDRG
jgi:hypothetical protein